MKKITMFLFVLSTVIIMFTVIVSAASGDVAGVYYATDVVTTLNGEEIRDIVIDGKTLISAEDMRYYGFSVNWLADSRELKIVTLDHAERGAPPVVVKTHQGGTIMGNYYETDIVTTVNGRVITAYNIGGETFIYTNELRDFGFLVFEHLTERKVEIISPEFAGFEYSIRLTQGKEQTTDGSGAFSLEYRKDSITAAGDAEYFTSSFHSSGDGYAFLLQFYQNEGLFYSGKLLGILNAITDETDTEAKEKLIHENIDVSINGIVIDKGVNVVPYFGNGHRSYYINVSGLPCIAFDDLKRANISIGEIGEDDVMYEIILSESTDDKVKAIAQGLMKYPLDWVGKYYETDRFIAINIRESEKLGVICDRLYIYNKETGVISDDILEQIRALDGYDSDELNLSKLSVKDVEKNLFFSCKLRDENGKYFIGDFYVDMEKCEVIFISDSRR